MDYVTDISAKRAELTPTKVAFHDVETGRELTFADVEDRANRLANALKGLGTAPGDRIAILCLNHPDFFVVLFACLKAHLVLVPLNWRQPAAELIPVMDRAQPRVLIHDGASAATAAALTAASHLPRIGLDPKVKADFSLDRLIDRAPNGSAGWGRRRASDPWYLLFTSGTTGQPKAVIQTFGMAWANAINIGQAIDLTSADTTINFLPLFHTGGINLYAMPVFLAGGTSHVLRKFEVDATLRLVDQGVVSAIFGVPAIYQALSLHPWFQEVDLTKVRSWACGGASLPEPLVRQFAGRGANVRNGFGMTETGPTVFLMDEASVATKTGSVGKAQILTDVRIVDELERPIEGVGTGELQIRGPGVTPGYFGDTGATRAAFADGGWLRSGDVAHRDADGYFFIVDRIKDMYISGGENVYPAEVERVLNTHPDILEAAVVSMPDQKWGEVGQAFLLPRPGRSIDLATLPVWCRKYLAPYKIPKQCLVVRDFPRTAAGKVQKHLLKEGERD